MTEPIFIYFSDQAPEGHPYAEQVRVECRDCPRMVLCLNEVMEAFFITRIGAICLNCFTKRYNDQDPKHLDALDPNLDWQACGASDCHLCTGSDNE
jgi:hypothetical protein